MEEDRELERKTFYDETKAKEKFEKVKKEF